MTGVILVVAVSLLVAPPSTVPIPPTTTPGPKLLARNATKRVVTTHSGLQFLVLRSGLKKTARPRDGDTVTFDYEGKLFTGETFDNSYERGEPLTGPVDGFVPGITEALKLMRPGDEWLV